MSNHVDWAGVAHQHVAVLWYVERDRMRRHGTPRQRVEASSMHMDVFSIGHFIDGTCRDFAQRLDNLGHAIAGAGMLAMVEQRTRQIVIKSLVRAHLIQEPRTNQVKPAEAMRDEPTEWQCAHCGRGRPESSCGHPCPRCGSGVLVTSPSTAFKQLDEFVPWPADKPIQYNGSGSPCDMWSGPCQCGATHRDGR